MHENDILIVLPKKLSRREKALLRDTTRRHKDVAEYGHYLIVENSSLGFNLGMNLVKNLGGVGLVHTFILGRPVFDDEMVNAHRREISLFQREGKIPKSFSPAIKARLRKQPGLPVTITGIAAEVPEPPKALKKAEG